MTQTFFEDLNGSNCTVGGQTIISLSVTESMDADYATASAVCIATGGGHAKGAEVEIVEGGIPTGLWVVDSWTTRVSGPETWRAKQGEAYAHIPFLTYTLRRRGYKEARATLSKSLLGSDHYPPKFCTTAHFGDLRDDANERRTNGELSLSQYNNELGSWIQVGSGSDIIDWICGKVGLSVTYMADLSCCAPEYLPVSKSVMAACREVASWAGADCYLARDGTLLVYDFNEQFNRGASVPQPTTVTKVEEKDSLFPISQCTVVGSGPAKYWVPAHPGHPRPPGGNPNIPAYDPPRPGYWETGNTIRAVEVTVTVPDGDCSIIEQRVEINEYYISPSIAEKIAQVTLAKAILGGTTVSLQGPAEGMQAVEPVLGQCFSVQRSLTWTGKAYRYLITIDGPRIQVNFPGPETDPSTPWW